jgi:hypothetical protein
VAESYEANGRGIVLLTGMESFCGVGSSELLLFQEESLVCSLADMAGLVDAGVDLVGKDGLVCIVEHDAMTLDQPGLKSRKETGPSNARAAHSLNWCSC